MFHNVYLYLFTEVSRDNESVRSSKGRQGVPEKSVTSYKYNLRNILEE